MIVLEGSIKEQFDTQTHILIKGDCSIVNPNIRHLDIYNEKCELLYIGISTDFFSEIIRNDVSFDNFRNLKHEKLLVYDLYRNYVFRQSSIAKEYILFQRTMHDSNLSSIVKCMIDETRSKKPAYYMQVNCLFIRFFHELHKELCYRSTFQSLVSTRQEKLFYEIEQLLSKYEGQISRTELSNQLGYSDHYINKIVQSQTGQSFVKFSRTFILQKAARLLIQTNMTIDDISFECGLSNTTYFHRIFKEYFNQTPAEYRTGMISS
ncbi:MAG: helix-turn-helix transcriptional regulator, partial [Eubacteriales bacterium]|nr:helix-turn-helix transcriptional regulator [Eubacteriales bacterium]